MDETGPPRACLPAFLPIVNAIENASRAPVTWEDIVSMMRHGCGNPSHLRALFGDVSLRTLECAAAAVGLDLRTVLQAYRVARKEAAAANPELDRMLDEPW